MRSYKLSAVVVGCWAALAMNAEAGIFRHRAGPRCAPPPCAAPAYCTPCANVGGHYEDRVVTRTICVPTLQTETRKVVECVMKPELRERTFNVTKRVPYTETLTQEYVVMVQKTQMRKVTQTVYKPVTKAVTQAYTVMVPHQEMRSGVRHVPTCEPVTIARTVCVDRGHWETRTIQVPCGPYGAGYGAYGGYGGYAPATAVYRGTSLNRVNYGPAGYAGYGGGYVGYGGCGSNAGCAPPMVTQCVRVWVPCIVNEQVQQTVMRTKLVPQDYQYAVTVCKPEQRTRTVQVCETVAEQVTQDVAETICVPEKRTRTYDVTKYQCVSEPKTEKYTVMVPHQVEREIQVQVCKMVPKTIEQTIKVWVPGCAPAAQEAEGSAPAAPQKSAPTAAPPKPAVL